jgi:hypothetical protein
MQRGENLAIRVPEHSRPRPRRPYRRCNSIYRGAPPRGLRMTCEYDRLRPFQGLRSLMPDENCSTPVRDDGDVLVVRTKFGAASDEELVQRHRDRELAALVDPSVIPLPPGPIGPTRSLLAQQLKSAKLRLGNCSLFFEHLNLPLVMVLYEGAILKPTLPSAAVLKARSQHSAGGRKKKPRPSFPLGRGLSSHDSPQAMGR